MFSLFNLKRPDWLLDQLPLKITALLVAILIWFHVKTVKVYEVDVPAVVTVQNVPGDLVLTSNLPSKIMVKVRGTGLQLLKLGNDAIQYQLDFSDQRNIGEQPVYLSADKIVFKGNPGLTVLHVPSYILCEFDRKITKHVKVKPVTGRPPSGFVFTDSITWSPREVEVSGPENAVKLLDELPTEAFIVDTPPESTQVIKKTINLALPDIVGLTVKPSVVQVSVGVEKVLERMLENCRVVPINIPEGRTVDIQPPTINITYRGAAGNLENLNPDSIRVVIDLKNKYHDFDEKLKAVVPEFRGVELVETQPEYFQAFIK